MIRVPAQTATGKASQIVYKIKTISIYNIQ